MPKIKMATMDELTRAEYLLYAQEKLPSFKGICLHLIEDLVGEQESGAKTPKQAE